MTSIPHREVSLSDKYELPAGEVFMTGLQALVRLPLEQHALDVAAGFNTATLISGYEGSPLAGYDLELTKQEALLAPMNIVVRPGVNEELAANAVQGSQLASSMASCLYDGVVGIWYGKAPGLDRASDALRHANLGGAASVGGALVLVGDDSIAKSSTVPSSSEVAIAELGMPIVVPGDPEDILHLGLHAIAMSRFSGLWVGMKLSTNVVDGSATTSLGSGTLDVKIPDARIDGTPYHHEVSANFLQPNLTQLESSLTGARLELARRYIVANGLCTVVGDPDARVGIIAAGATYRDTIQAFKRLGLDESLAGSGLRVLRLGAIHPLDPQTIIDFARGLDEIIVVEEKRAFVELAVKDILFSLPARPSLHGKRGPNGAPLMRAHSDLPPEYIAERLAIRLADHPSIRFDTSRVAREGGVQRPLLPILNRTPYFCSGCPHNRSTEVPDGSLVGVGIGCHAIVAMMPGERVGDVVGMSQMGGEGAPWIGIAPFVTDNHLIQNLGDGTYHHSGSLAIRASVAARSNITFKLLYNDAVAMTGGQQAVGKMSVPNIVQELLAEGVAEIVITTDDVAKYKRTKLPRSVKVLDRSKVIEVQERLASVEGVTILIHDQECATELRRKRKRKLVAEPVERAFINERVCEGCGDCGKKSNCMSVQPVDTDFGRKTRIDQASCNKDYSCLDGDCPSFVSVVTASGRKRPRAREGAEPSVLPPPPSLAELSDFGLRITGMGGTGVVTTAQIIATAAAIAGAHVQGLDQLGLAQKGGAVVSDLRISRNPGAGANKLAPGDCDLYLGCDVLVACDARNLAVVSSDRTIAIVSSSKVPPGSMILDPSRAFPTTEETTSRISELVRADHSAFADVREISRSEFGSDQYANVMLVGMAVQSGALPLEPSFVERAIELNGVAVETNRRAFEAGRQIILDPSQFEHGLVRKARSAQAAKVSAATDLLADDASEELRHLVERNVAELIDYQSRSLAREYVGAVETIRSTESQRLGGGEAIALQFAGSLFKLMAYKDEYEVARLYLDPMFESSLRREFGDGVSFRYRLHPPALRALGYSRKISLGPWFKLVFRVLRVMRGVRGTWIDPFGFAKVRRVERALVPEFRDAMVRATSAVTPQTKGTVLDLAGLPELVRGYEDIKLHNVVVYRERLTNLMNQV